MANKRGRAERIRRSHLETAVAALFLAVGGGALFVVPLAGSAPPALRHLSLYMAGFCLVPAAGFWAAILIGHARRAGPPGRRTGPASGGRKLPRPIARLRDLAATGGGWLLARDWLGAWLPLTAAFLLSLLALYAFSRGWRMAAPGGGARFNQFAGMALLLACFPLLVLERGYAGLPDDGLGESRRLADLCRVPLMGALVLALAAGLRWLGLPYASLIENAAAAIAALVALEITLRMAAFLFLPLPPLSRRASPVYSVVAGLIEPRIPDIRSLNASVRSQFGIDLARSWSLGFIRRAAPVLVLGMVILSWLLTGVTAIGTGERAVYQSFGNPRGVLHPGLHLHLPWPFGTLRPVPFGQVEKVAVAGGEEDAGAADDERGTDGPAPRSADRIWDSSRQEAGYVVASKTDGQQGFEAIDIDINVVYRIGLSDGDAIEAAYRMASPGGTVKAIAQQLLAHYFARNTLPEVLGENRQAYVHRFQGTLQQRLDQLNSGIEVLAVVVEAIHPPPKAAGSYQAVQASAIEAGTKVNTARAEAVRVMKMAALVANATRNDAQSEAAERLSRSHVDALRFGGERAGYTAGGASFLLEQRLDSVIRGLSDKGLIIVDHRIAPADVPGFDMRNARAAQSRFGDPGAD